MNHGQDNHSISDFLKHHKNIKITGLTDYPIKQETQRTRRNLMAVSAVLIVSCISKIDSNGLSFWGITFRELDTVTLYCMLSIVIIYELVSFILRYRSDFAVWNEKIIEIEYHSPGAFVGSESIINWLQLLDRTQSSLKYFSENPSTQNNQTKDLIDNLRQVSIAFQADIELRKDDFKKQNLCIKWIEFWVPVAFSLISLIYAITVMVNILRLTEAVLH